MHAGAQWRGPIQALVLATAALLLTLAPAPLASQQVLAQGGPDLRVTKSSQGQFYVGSTSARYHIYVWNASSTPTTGPISLTDVLPTGMTVNSIFDPFNAWSCGGTTAISCTHAASLAANASTSITIYVNMSVAAVGERSNTATASTTGDTDLSNNTSSPSVVTVLAAAPPPDMRIFKGHEGDFVVDSANAVYRFSVENHFTAGPTIGPVTVTDVLPIGMTFHSIDAPGGFTDGWSCNGTTTVTCSRATPINSGTIISFRIRVNIASPAIGLRSNTATVSTPGEADTSNNTSNVELVTVPGTPVNYVLSVTKFGNGSGTVTSNLAGISCGADCSQPYSSGTIVTLIPTATAGSTFSNWGGACSGAGACQVTMDGARSVTAAFKSNTVPNNAGVQVSRVPGSPPGGPTLQATLTARANCGSIVLVQFGTPGTNLRNARVRVTAPGGGPTDRTASFTYTPPPNTISVTFTIQRVVQVGGATVTPIRLFDGCGEWKTIAGGGARAFD